MNEQPATAPATPVGDVLVPRIAAALIDVVILFVVFVIFAVLFGDSGSSSEDGAGFSLNLEGLPALIYFLVVIAYYVVFEAQNGQTPGKRVMKLRVVAINGQLTLGKVLLRTVLRVIDGLPVFYLLGLIIVLVSRRKQRIGDIAAGTFVVRT